MKIPQFDFAIPKAPAFIPHEINIVGFAGGGGSSIGLHMAGLPIHHAMNHDRFAMALHAHQEPFRDTKHHIQNIWQVDPRDLIEGGQRFGFTWFSPDCTDFSKAKGDVPKRKHIRDLAWVTHRYTKLPKRSRPRCLAVENVEEFEDWGPLRDDGTPDPDKRGVEFQRWVAEMRRDGYRVEWKELRACDSGAPTVRKRLFVVARCDGEPICWPVPKYGPAGSGLLPYRGAAECIDWSIPCPSIFLTREEAQQLRKDTGIICQRPLKPNTMDRVAGGLAKFVIDHPNPFMVPVTHPQDKRVYDIEEPMRTITAANRGEFALVSPFVRNITQGGERTYAADEPLRTMTTAKGGEFAVVAPYLVPRYGERPGQAPRCRSIEEPMATIVPTGNEGQLVAAFVPQHNISRGVGHTGHDARDPMSSILTTGSHQGVVTAYMAQANFDHEGRPLTEPLSTVTSRATQQQLVAAFMSNHYSSNANGGQGDPREPLTTVTAQGQHQSVVHVALGGQSDRTEQVVAFLTKYYSGGGTEQDARDPLHTVTAKARFGLVKALGMPIYDIGMRMLWPPELFAAQGFPGWFRLDVIIDGKPITKTKLTEMCGNSVSPPQACDIALANGFGHAVSDKAAAVRIA